MPRWLKRRNPDWRPPYVHILRVSSPAEISLFEDRCCETTLADLAMEVDTEADQAAVWGTGAYAWLITTGAHT